MDGRMEECGGGEHYEVRQEYLAVNLPNQLLRGLTGGGGGEGGEGAEYRRGAGGGKGRWWEESLGVDNIQASCVPALAEAMASIRLAQGLWVM